MFEHQGSSSDLVREIVDRHAGKEDGDGGQQPYEERPDLVRRPHAWEAIVPARDASHRGTEAYPRGIDGRWSAGRTTLSKTRPRAMVAAWSRARFSVRKNGSVVSVVMATPCHNKRCLANDPIANRYQKPVHDASGSLASRLIRSPNRGAFARKGWVYAERELSARPARHAAPTASTCE